MTDEQASEILARLSALEEENKSLKARIQLAPDFASGIPNEFRHTDPKINGVDASKFARRAVLVTSAGLAEDYATSVGLPESSVINADGLIKNSRSNPIKE